MNPYKTSFQANKDYYKAEDWLIVKSPIAYRIFRFLVNSMDQYNNAICSHKIIQEAFSISPSTVSRAIKILKEEKYVEIYKYGSSNTYAINKNIVWSGKKSDYKYAKFGADITFSEEQKSIKTKIIEHKKIVIKQ